MIRESSTRQVKSVRTGFRIIEILQNRDGVRPDELERQLELAKSTIHNYLSTLESMGYVVEREGTYHLGLRFLRRCLNRCRRWPERSANPLGG